MTPYVAAHKNTPHVKTHAGSLFVKAVSSSLKLACICLLKLRCEPSICPGDNQVFLKDVNLMEKSKDLPWLSDCRLIWSNCVGGERPDPYGTDKIGSFRQLYGRGGGGGGVGTQRVALLCRIPLGISEHALARGRMSWLRGTTLLPCVS